MRSRSHHMQPRKSTVRCIFAYKNFAAMKGISHIGLGVAALNTSKVLRRHGYWSEVWPIGSADDLKKRLLAAQEEAARQGQIPVSHVIISAPWITGPEMMSLVSAHPEIAFCVTLHSNVGFLQADPRAFTILRDGLNLSQSVHNFVVGGNCERFTDWIQRTYNAPCVFLPNLYDTSSFVPYTSGRQYQRGDTLRIGCFGATRVLKNAITAGAAALQIAKQLGASLEFWINRGRDGGEHMLRGLMEMYGNERAAVVREQWWQSWPEFRRTVGHMHLLMQPSFTESFNMVTADGIAEGVCTVASEAINWVPRRWQGNADDTGDLARVGLYLLNDNCAIEEGREALAEYVTLGLEEYRKFFSRRL